MIITLDICIANRNLRVIMPQAKSVASKFSCDESLSAFISKLQAATGSAHDVYDAQSTNIHLPPERRSVTFARENTEISIDQSVNVAISQHRTTVTGNEEHSSKPNEHMTKMDDMAQGTHLVDSGPQQSSKGKGQEKKKKNLATKGNIDLNSKSKMSIGQLRKQYTDKRRDISKDFNEKVRTETEKSKVNFLKRKTREELAELDTDYDKKMERLKLKPIPQTRVPFKKVTALCACLICDKLCTLHPLCICAICRCPAVWERMESSS